MFDELEKYSLEGLIQLCKSKDIPVKENSTKEELIEKLIAPVVIDLTNNYEFIKELENNLRDRIKDIQSNGLGNHRDIKIRDASFDIEIENQDLFEILRYVGDRLTLTWEDKYELAK